MRVLVRQYLLIILLFLSTIFVIIFGNIYFDQRNKNQAIVANIGQKTKVDQEQNKDDAPNEGDLKSDVANDTILNDLVKESQRYGSARISLLGSSIPQKSSLPKEKTWISLLQSDLKSNVKDLGQLSYIVNDYGSLTTTEILKQDLAEVIKQQVPTIILFEMAIFNDYRQNIPIELTLANLEKIMNQFAEKAPNAKVVFLSPNRTTEMGSNLLGLKPKDYLERSKEFIQAKGWNFIDIYEGFEKQRLNEGRALSQVLLKDGRSPNVMGNQYIFHTVKEYLMKQGEQGTWQF
ncbi:SGNH/GDSL hydrolase family protein [Tepidibacillus sp. LV47]|uniref:SGNH/GDSL hydrolase family protein n=1 Tax=Tepidibacillus sp. LV47 TaxID=3398228 RepID=UPI003AAC41BC